MYWKYDSALPDRAGYELRPADLVLDADCKPRNSLLLTNCLHEQFILSNVLIYGLIHKLITLCRKRVAAIPLVEETNTDEDSLEETTYGPLSTRLSDLSEGHTEHASLRGHGIGNRNSDCCN